MASVEVAKRQDLPGFSAAPSIRDLEYLRVTALRTFEECPHTWASRWLGGVEGDKSEAASIGTAVHAICEDLLMSLHQPGHEPADTTEHWRIVPEHEQGNVHEYLESLAGLPLARALAVEERFYTHMRDDAPPISGQWDFVAETHGGALLIVDHKTNRTAHSKDWWAAQLQPLMYAWAARQEWPEYKEVVFRIGYPNLGSSVQWVTDPADDDRLRNRFNSIWTRMLEYEASRNWPQTINDNCTWCPVKSQCAEHNRVVNAFRDSFTEKVGRKHPAEQLKFVKQVEKIVTHLRAELEEAVAAMVVASGGTLEAAGHVWTLEKTATRKAQFADAWAALNRLADSIEPIERERITAAIDDVFSVKVGGLDRLAKMFPGFGETVAEIAPRVEAASPTLKEKPLVRRVEK